MRDTAGRLRATASLAELGALLDQAIDNLEAAVTHVLAGAADANAPGAASYNLLMLAGTVLGAEVSGRAALAVSDADVDAEFGPGFGAAKLATATFYFRQVLPQAAAFGAAATSGAATVMDMPESSF